MPLELRIEHGQKVQTLLARAHSPPVAGLGLEDTRVVLQQGCAHARQTYPSRQLSVVLGPASDLMRRPGAR